MHEIKWNIDDPMHEIKPYWEMCVGSGHAALALREDYRKQLARCHRELGFRYVRFHGLLDDDMSVLKKKQYAGREEWILSFTNIDSIFDFILSIGMKPFVEIGFMPECLASKKTTIFHYKGFTSKPKSYERWEWLIRELIQHLIVRYGRGEIREWFFEIWNEPDIGGENAEDGFWTESKEEYFNLYRHTVTAIKQVDSCLKVGGPATSFNKWIPEFLEFCKTTGTAVDFVSTHHYPTDVVWATELSLKVSEELSIYEEANRTEPDFLKKQKSKQNMVWKYIERGVVTPMVKQAVKEAGKLPVYYTEWNSLSGFDSDGTFGSSYILKTIMDNIGLVEGYSYWTFSDIFEEDGMPSKAFHGGFGLMTLQGIPKAPYRAFELLHKLGNLQYEKMYANKTIDIWAFQKKEWNAVQILAVNHQALCHAITEETIQCGLEGASIKEATMIRLDETHGNAINSWIREGKPDELTDRQRLKIEADSCIEEKKIEHSNGCVEVCIPPMGAALITFYLE